MNKSFRVLIAVALCVLILASCNVDGEHGLYTKLATSVPSSDLRIMDYLYHDSGTHYFLTTANGVYSTPSTLGGTTLLEGTSGKFITGAWVRDTSSFFLLDTYMKLYTYDGITVTGSSETDYRGLSANGYFYNHEKFKYTDSGSDIPVSMPYTPLFSGSSMLAKTSESTATIYYEGASKFTVSGLPNVKNISGFQEIDADNYLLFYSNKGYLVTGSIDNLSSASHEFSVSVAAPTGGYRSVLYDTGKVLLRSSQSFHIIDVTSGTPAIEKVSWISALNDVDVVSMFKTESNKVAVATYENGIHIVDISAKTVGADIL